MMAAPLFAAWNNECVFCEETFAITYPLDDVCPACVLEHGEGVADALEWLLTEMRLELEKEGTDENQSERI